MAVNIGYKGWIFAIDTNTYSGNFEREMCAFLTGRWGECGVGKDIAEQLQEEMPDMCMSLGEIITDVADDHGCLRPVTIYPTPGFYNNGMGGIFTDSEDKHALDDMIMRCKAEGDKYADNRERWERRAQEPLQKYPSYQSVAIFFNELPSEIQINFMMKRAYKFARGEWKGRLRDYYHPIEIIGFRLLKLETVQKIEKQWGSLCKS